MTRSTKTLDTNNVVNVNLLGMKPGSPKEEFAFEIYKGYGDSKEVIEKHATSIKGKLMKIECGAYDYVDERGQSRKNKTLTFRFDDGETTMKYGTGYNMITRQIVYNLYGLTKIGEIELIPYISKKGFKSVWMKNDGEDVRMTLDYNNDILSKVDKYPTGNDYNKLNEWIETELVSSINDVLKEQEEDKLPF